jgi:hypothetical protein
LYCLKAKAEWICSSENSCHTLSINPSYDHRKNACAKSLGFAQSLHLNYFSVHKPWTQCQDLSTTCPGPINLSQKKIPKVVIVMRNFLISRSTHCPWPAPRTRPPRTFLCKSTKNAYCGPDFLPRPGLKTVWSYDF